MGLIISSSEEQKITILGTEIELPEIYGRIEFAGRMDGKTLEISVSNYASKQAYKTGANIISTNVQSGSFKVEIEDDEIQSMETSHKYAKQLFESIGFDVEINL